MKTKLKLKKLKTITMNEYRNKYSVYLLYFSIFNERKKAGYFKMTDLSI